jgi:esterase/lipase superfamily enzyme
MFTVMHPTRVRFVAALALGLVALAVCPARGDEAADGEPAASLAEADCPTELDLWVASTRRLPEVCAAPSQANLAVERLVGQPGSRCWERADLAGLFADPTRPLVIFVHGNRYESADAKEQGLRLARRLADYGPEGRNPRVVIFSWPSQKQGLLLKDGRRKYERAYADGHYLAWLLGQLPPEQPVALVGYSFGALVAAEALEDLARGSAGIPWAQRTGRTHLVFVAPALRYDAFAPRGPFRSVLAGVDRFTLLVNSQDEALRFFPLLEPAVRVDALGYVGMRRDWLPAELEYAASDAAGIVGKLHTMRRYLDSRPLAERIATGALVGLAD